jgi:hypothetical protein
MPWRVVQILAYVPPPRERPEGGPPDWGLEAPVEPGQGLPPGWAGGRPVYPGRPGQGLPWPERPADPGWGVEEGAPGQGLPPWWAGGYPGRPGQGLPWNPPGRPVRGYPIVPLPEDVGGHPELPDLNAPGFWGTVRHPRALHNFPAWIVLPDDGGDRDEERHPVNGQPGSWVTILLADAELAWAWCPSPPAEEVEPEEPEPEARRALPSGKRRNGRGRGPGAGGWGQAQRAAEGRLATTTDPSSPVMSRRSSPPAGRSAAARVRALTAAWAAARDGMVGSWRVMTGCGGGTVLARRGLRGMRGSFRVWEPQPYNIIAGGDRRIALC